MGLAWVVARARACPRLGRLQCLEPVHHPTYDPVAALTLELEQGGRLSEQPSGEN